MIDSRGFASIGLIGLLLVAGVLTWATAVVQVEGHAATASAYRKALRVLEWRVESFRAGVRSLLRASAEDALQFSKRVHVYDRHELEFVTSRAFWSRLERLSERLPLPNATLSLPGIPAVRFKEAQGGELLVEADLEDFVLEVHTPDSRISLSRSLGKISTLVAPRFFLLKRLMGEFSGSMGRIEEEFGRLEWGRMWAEAWLRGSVTLSPRIDRALLEASWVLREREVFGSFDPYGVISAVSGLEVPAVSGSPGVDSEWLRDLKELVMDSRQKIRECGAHLESALTRLGSGNPEEALGEIEISRSLLDEGRRNLQEVSRLAGERSGEDSFARVIGSNSVFELAEEVMGEVDSILMRAENVIAGGIDNENFDPEPEVRGLLAPLTVLPEPRWRTSGGGGSETGEEMVPVYLYPGAPPSLPGLSETLGGVENDLGRLLSLIPSAPSEVPKIDEFLSVSTPSLPISREELYELTPPLLSSQGLAVLHSLDVEVEYRREDPAGLAGSPLATPVPLPFLDLTVWWGQVRVVAELKGGFERVIDHSNPVLLSHGQSGFLHLPYSLTHELEDRNFEVRIVLLSLRSFSFFTG